MATFGKDADALPLTTEAFVPDLQAYLETQMQDMRFVLDACAGSCTKNGPSLAVLRASTVDLSRHSCYPCAWRSTS